MALDNMPARRPLNTPLLAAVAYSCFYTLLLTVNAILPGNVHCALHPNASMKQLRLLSDVYFRWMDGWIGCAKTAAVRRSQAHDFGLFQRIDSGKPPPGPRNRSSLAFPVPISDKHSALAQREQLNINQPTYRAGHGRSFHTNSFQFYIVIVDNCSCCSSRPSFDF